MRGDVERLAALARGRRGDQAAIAAQLEELAADRYIGITPHRVVVDRALAAVDRVHDEIREMQASGGMKAVNRAFKSARTAAPSLRYQDHLDALKLKLVEQMAAQMT